MRCAIVVPDCLDCLQEIQEPLGAEAICGYLRQKGMECRIFDRRIGAGLEQIKAYEPAAIGFSVMTEKNIKDALRLLLELKDSEICFFAGGLFITQEYRRARALFPSWVVLIAGEGEKAVWKLLQNQEELSDILMDPDEWAFASRDDLPAYLNMGGVINLRSARGCRGNCSFCINSGKSAEFRAFETRSLSLIVDEMEQLIDRGCSPIFNFTDDEFGDLDRIRELNHRLKSRKIRAAYSLELRPSVMTKADPADWSALHEGGLCRVFTGLESINAETLKKWHKAVDPEALYLSVKACRNAHILCETGYILFHEDSTPEDLGKEIEWLHRRKLFSPKVALSRLIYYPGSLLHNENNVRGTQFCTLSPEVEIIYQKWLDALKILFNFWGKCALRLPTASCRAFLSGDNTILRQMTQCLDTINDASYACIVDNTVPDIAAIESCVYRTLEAEMGCFR